MKNTHIIFLLPFISTTLFVQPTSQRNILFDSDWKIFNGGDQGAENAQFDDLE